MLKFLVIRHKTEDSGKAICLSFNSIEERKQYFVNELTKIFVDEAQQFLKQNIGIPLKIMNFGELRIYVNDTNRFIQHLNGNNDEFARLEEKQTTDETVIEMITTKALEDAIEVYDRIVEYEFWTNAETSEVFTFVTIQV